MIGKISRCFVMLVLLVNGNAMAINLRFLDRAPVSRFNDQDMKMLQAAFEKTMNEGEDGATVAWKNERTTSGGTITPIESFERKSAKCRKVRFTTEHRTLRGESEFSFCRNAKGTWRLLQ